MATTISVRLDKELLKDLSKIEENWQADRSEAVRRLLAKAVDSWKMQNALEKLRQHKISIGKAAEECGISLWEMLDILKENNIDWTGYSKADLEKDLKILEGKF
jgi:predicted HTH domain antitoxin